MNSKNLQIYHLSHTDLDGYGSQFIINKIFNKSNSNITYFNVNYGESLNAKIEYILNTIKKDLELNKTIYFLITDLNLNEGISKEINIFIKNYKKEIDSKKLTIQVLDHHLSFPKVEKYSNWYKIDNSKCATKIVFEHFESLLNDSENELKKYLKDFSEMVEALDLWKKGTELFNKALLMSELLYDTNSYIPDIEEFSNINREFKFYILTKIFDLFSKGFDIEDIELNSFMLKKTYIDIKKSSLKDLKNISMKIKFNEYLYDYSIENGIFGETFKTKNSLNYKILFNFREQGNYLANKFLENNKEIDFVILISSKGTLSLRSIGDVNVKQISEENFKGGGHKNASGGFVKLEGKETKEEIINILTSLLS